MESTVRRYRNRSNQYTTLVDKYEENSNQRTHVPTDAPPSLVCLPSHIPEDLMTLPELAAIAARLQMTSHDEDLSVHDDDGDTFHERQRSHFLELLREKWKCPQEGHSVCVPTEDGQHFQLEDGDINHWVDALCRYSGSTANPPHVIFDNIGGGAVFNRNNGELKVRAVSVAPSRKAGPDHRSLDHTPGSIDGTVATGSSRNSLQPSVWSSSTTETATSRSSFSPGPGHFFGKAINFFGEKGLDAVGYTRLSSQYKTYKSSLEKWEKDRPALDADVRAKVLKMLEDALELSRECNSTNVNNKGYHIGRAVHHWLHTYDNIPESPEVLIWHIKVQVSLIPILLTRISRADPLAGDLAHRTLHTLTRVSLAEQDTKTAAKVVWHVARELAYAKCSFQHAWLGVSLLRIVQMSLKLRRLTNHEIKAIRELAVRRKEQPTNYAGQDNVWRPWEVALFAQCASQNSWFKEFVVGAHGLPNLIAALDTMLAKHVNVREVHWENVALTLRSLAFLSEQEWVASSVEPGIVRSLLAVFKRSIPERWFCIRFWAADAIHNLVAHRPSLTRTLLQEDAISAFETLTNPQIDHELSAANRSQSSRQRQLHVHPVPHSPQIPPVPPTAQSPIDSSSIPISSSPQQIPDLLRYSPTTERRVSTSSSTSSGPVTPPATSDHRMFRLPTRRPSQSVGVERPPSTSSSQSTMRPNPQRPPLVIPTPSQGRLLEEYKVAATKRAEELSVYVRKWTEWSPDKLPMLEVPRLEALGAEWLTEWVGAGWTGEAEREGEQ